MRLIFLVPLLIQHCLLFAQANNKIAETDSSITYKIKNDTTVITKPVASSHGVRYLEISQTSYYKGDLSKEINRLIVYPADAIKNKIEGVVKLHCRVDSTGKLYDPIILYSVYPSIDKEALRIIQFLPKFEPSKLTDGTAVGSVVRIDVPFQL